MWAWLKHISHAHKCHMIKTKACDWSIKLSIKIFSQSASRKILMVQKWMKWWHHIVIIEMIGKYLSRSWPIFDPRFFPRSCFFILSYIYIYYISLSQYKKWQIYHLFFILRHIYIFMPIYGHIPLHKGHIQHYILLTDPR